MGYRDPWTVDWCNHLQAMIHHSSAPDGIGEGEHVIVLPLWVWAEPGVNMGAKSSTPTGQPLEVPVRLVWDQGPVLALRAGQSIEVQATAQGLGYTGAARFRITADGSVADRYQSDTYKVMVPPQGWGISPDHIGVGPMAVSRLSMDAHEAGWKARMSLEQYVRRAVSRAVRIVSADVLMGQHRQGADVIDAATAEQVADEMLLGTATNPGAVARILERCQRPGVFANVDPVHYVRTDLQRTAVAYVRRAIGDPAIGTKIRRLHRQMPTATLHELVAAYNARNPADPVGLRRVSQALTAGRDANAGTTEFHEDLAYGEAAA